MIAANALVNCTIVPVGLARQAGLLTLDLFSEDAADSSASLVPNFRPGERVLRNKTVAVLSLAELPDGVLKQGTAVVKIDVEGAELEVIEALLPVLRNDRPFVLIEILPAYTPDRLDRTRRQESIEQHFRELDYTLLRIERLGEGLEGLAKIKAIGIHGNMDLCDYLAVPTDWEPRVVSAF